MTVAELERCVVHGEAPDPLCDGCLVVRVVKAVVSVIVRRALVEVLNGAPWVPEIVCMNPTGPHKLGERCAWCAAEAETDRRWLKHNPPGEGA